MTGSRSYNLSKAPFAPALQGEWDGPCWDSIEPVSIDWAHPKSSAHHPFVQVKTTYIDRGEPGEGIYLYYKVEDHFVAARRMEYQQPVCRDSCVEFFVRPRENMGYFNLEINCAGTMLFYYVEDPRRTPQGLAKATPIPWNLASRIRLRHTLDGPILQELAAEPDNPALPWEIEYHIPVDIFEQFIGPVGDLCGQSWRANFYKCADESSHPHWLAWSPVGDELNFHQPDRFGTLHFMP